MEEARGGFFLFSIFPSGPLSLGLLAGYIKGEWVETAERIGSLGSIDRGHVAA